MDEITQGNTMDEITQGNISNTEFAYIFIYMHIN